METLFGDMSCFHPIISLEMQMSPLNVSWGILKNIQTLCITDDIQRSQSCLGSSHLPLCENCLGYLPFLNFVMQFNISEWQHWSRSYWCNHQSVCVGGGGGAMPSLKYVTQTIFNRNPFDHKTSNHHLMFRGAVRDLQTWHDTHAHTNTHIYVYNKEHRWKT